MVNLFAFCATHPEDLKRAAHPVGPRNMRTLKHQASRAERIVAAWGVHGTHRDQDRRVIRALSNHTLQCFGRTKKGEPLHPLYQKREASVSNYRGK